MTVPGPESVAKSPLPVPGLTRTRDRCQPSLVSPPLSSVFSLRAALAIW